MWNLRVYAITQLFYSFPNEYFAIKIRFYVASLIRNILIQTK